MLLTKRMDPLMTNLQKEQAADAPGKTLRLDFAENTTGNVSQKGKTPISS